MPLALTMLPTPKAYRYTGSGSHILKGGGDRYNAHIRRLHLFAAIMSIFCHDIFFLEGCKFVSPNPPTEARFSDSAFLYNHLFQMANMIRGKINFESLVVNGWRKQSNKTIFVSKVLHFYLFIFLSS